MTEQHAVRPGASEEPEKTVQDEEEKTKIPEGQPMGEEKGADSDLQQEDQGALKIDELGPVKGQLGE